MKTTFFKSTVIALALGVMLNSGVFAQSTPANTNAKPAANTTKTTTTTKEQTDPNKGEVKQAREETKDEWLKHYSDMKPKLDAMASNAKMETKNPEFSSEAKKLDEMETSFKGKLDGWDKAHAGTADAKNAYMKDLRQSHDALDAQYNKTKGMWDKMHASAPEKKAEPKAAPAKPAVK